MKIGIYGGTFDPPHMAHLSVAQACVEQLELDEIIFLPNYRNPLKGREAVTPAKQRLEMVRLLISGKERLAVSDIELTRGGPSYAVDTMSELQMAQAADYWFILGMDNVRQLSKWKAPERLIRLCRLAAVGRSGTGSDILYRFPQEFRDRIDVVQMEPLPISSTDIRNLIFQQKDVSKLVPANVLAYIRDHKLYRKTE